MTQNISIVQNANQGNASMPDGTPVALDGLLIQDCRLFFPKMPTVNFFLQGIQLPDVSVNEVKQYTRYVDPNQIGEKVNFEPFSVRFMVDKQFKNWNEIFDWMKRMTVKGTSIGETDDAIIIIGGKNVLRFVDAWPTRLGGVEFDATVPEAQYVKCQLEINYDYIDYIGQYATVNSSYTAKS